MNNTVNYYLDVISMSQQLFHMLIIKQTSEWETFVFARDGIGKEVINQITTSLQTDKTYYTDSNGREMLKRV